MRNKLFGLTTNGYWALGILLFTIALILVLNPPTEVFQNALASMCSSFRGPVTVFCYICLAVLLFLIFTRYGSIRLGGKDAKTEMSTFSWLACLFMAGCGIGIVFYCQEPILHYYDNPYYGSVEGEKEYVAYSLTLFNWTINCWSQYGLLGVAIAYFYFNLGHRLKLSSILPEKTPVWVKRVIDVVMALGVIAGLTTSMGLGVAQICNGFEYVFNVNLNPYLLMGIIAVVATWSVVSGLKRGVKWLSNISFILVTILLVSVVGIALFSLHVTSFPSYIGKGTYLLFRNFISYNDFYHPASTPWAAAYPIFFDLWFAAWAAFVAVFVARISKGRTIREFIIGVVAVPTLFTILWFGIFGTVGVEYKELIYETMQENVPTSIFIFFEHIAPTAYTLLSVVVFMIICLFFITSADSGSYVVASLLTDSEEPRSGEKVFWSATQCIVAMILFACGGLALVQSVSVIMGIIVMLLIAVGGYIFLRRILKIPYSRLSK